VNPPRPPSVPPIDVAGRRYIDKFQVEARLGVAVGRLERWAAKGITNPHSLPFRVVRRRLTFYVDEECVTAAELERFRTYPENKAAGKLQIGPTADGTGYLNADAASRFAHVTTNTLLGALKHGGELYGVKLESVRDSFYRNRWYISERSLRDAVQARLASGRPLRP
jgi:hypothetical protein